MRGYYSQLKIRIGKELGWSPWVTTRRMKIIVDAIREQICSGKPVPLPKIGVIGLDIVPARIMRWQCGI